MALGPSIPIEIQALQWYPLGIAHEVELLERYVVDLENQVEQGIADYRKGIAYHEYPDPFSPNGTERVQYYGNVNGYTWDLNSVFAEYFPNLQRGSAVISLFTFFEYEMHRLCLLLKKIEAAKVGPEDSGGKGIERSTAYLKRIASIETHKDSPEWAAIIGIRLFRNNWAHAAGRLPPQPLNELVQTELFKYVHSSKFLELNRLNISIKRGFLEHVLGAFDRYFQLIHDSLEAKYKPKPAVP